MRAVAIILLLGVFIRHFSVWGGIWDFLSFSPQAVFYMLGGALESILFAVIGFIMLNANRSYWRDLVLIACVIGVIEGATTTGCRVAISNIFAVPKDIDLCDYLTGFHFQAWRLAMYLLFIAGWTLFGRKRNATKPARSY